MPKVNKALAILAALAFFLPFITISCNGTALVEVSGAKLAQCAISTCSPKDILSPNLKKLGGMNIPNMDLPTQTPAGKPNGLDDANFVLFAAIACVVAALTLFFGGRGGELLSGVASIAAIALLFVFRSKFGDAVGANLHSPQQMGAAAAMINIQLEFSSGFWLSMILSAASAILAFKGTAGAPSPVRAGGAGSVGGLAPRPSAGSSSSSSSLLSACPSCGAGNSGGNKFCLSCGTSLAAPPPAAPLAAKSVASSQGAACPSCGANNPALNKFCLSCGGSLMTGVQLFQPSETGETAAPPAPPAAAAAAAGQASAPVTVALERPKTEAPAPEPPPLSATQAAVSAPVAQPLPATAPSAQEPDPSPKSTLPEPQQPTSQAVSVPEQTRPQQQACAACGAAVTPGQKFCLACGTPVGPAATAAEPPPAAAIGPATPADKFQTTIQPGPFQTPPRSGNKALLIVVLLLAVLGAAGWYVWRYFARPDVTVTAFPQKIHVAAGGRTSLEAGVSGSTDTDVAWTIQEGNKGGQITPMGSVITGGQARAGAAYSAPQAAGVFHVIAASHANPSRVAKVEIVVGDTAQSETTTTAPQPPPAAASAVAAAAANPMAAQMVGTWRGPSPDMKTAIGADSTIAMTSDTDPQKNKNGTYRFTDNSHLEIDFGNGDVRKWEIQGVDDKYLRVIAQSKDGTAAVIFAKISS